MNRSLQEGGKAAQRTQRPLDGENLPWEIKPSRNRKSLEGNHSKKNREYPRKTLQRNQRPLEGNHFREPENNVEKPGKSESLGGKRTE